MSESFVYVTAGSAGEAHRIARTVVGERLAACANILPPITSVYWWQGTLETAEETAFLLKTRSDLVEPLIARIRALHSYDCPAIVAWPIAAGNPAFLAWIAAETTPPAG
jgi:periplasmic divalent cation tolerance protein